MPLLLLKNVASINVVEAEKVAFHGQRGIALDQHFLV